MKVSHWYSIHQRNNSITVEYSMHNRIISVIVFVLITSVFFYYTFILHNELIVWSVLVVSVIVLVSLLMSVLSDKYEFNFDTNVLMKCHGIYPLIKKDFIPIRDITEVDVSQFENTSFLYHIARGVNPKYTNTYFNLKIGVKNKATISLGSFGEERKYIINTLKEKVLLARKCGGIKN